MRLKYSRPDSHSTKGFTLVEISVVIGIIGGVIGGIWIAANAVRENSKVADTSQALTELLYNTRRVLITQTANGSSGFVDAATLGILPQEFTVSSGALPTSATGMGPVTGRHAWGKAILVYYVSPNIASGVQANGVFTFMMDSLPKAACIKLVTQIAGMGKDNGLLSIGNYEYYSDTNSTSTFPIPPNTPICSNSINNVQFLFSLTDGY